MRQVVLRLPAPAVEDVLDRLLPSLPDGVREVPDGQHVELQIRGRELPSLTEISQAVGHWPHQLTEQDVPDDWRARRRLDYRPELIGRRLMLRPDWAPESPDRQSGLIEIVLAETAAFGAGTHPTTRTCLELLLDIDPGGAFIDLGCGTGVLAILAARLGWAPVLAVDRDQASIEATKRNAAANDALIDARTLDLLAEDPPAADGCAANVPAPVHLRIAARMRSTRSALVSGFEPIDAKRVLDAYAAAGLRERRSVRAHGWVVSVLRGR